MHRPWSALLLLWISAILLDLWGIQFGPLRDWDEGLVARVALELSEKRWPDLLMPTLWGKAYLNKPPGAHGLIAGMIHLWKWHTGAMGLPPGWVVRVGPALGSSLLAPLLGLVQWQLRPGKRADAIWTGVIAVTLLPLARHAHLAMLDGLQLTAIAMLWLGLLVGENSRRWALTSGLLAGLASSALLLLKAPVAMPVLLTGLLLRGVDGDREDSSWRWLLLGLTMGLLPGLSWHGWHLASRGEEALLMWGRQGLVRVTQSIENHGGGPIPPLIQVLSGGWPWLPLWPVAIVAAWRERRQRWGRWSLGLTAMATLLVLPLQTQLPWYSLLLWPPFALCCGPVASNLIHGRSVKGWRRGVPLIWQWMGGLVAVLLVVLVPLRLLPALALVVLPAGVGLLVGGTLLLRETPLHWRRRGALLLVFGWCTSLLLLFSSPDWNWELNERRSIQPLITLVSQASRHEDPAVLPLVVDGKTSRRPSVRWYAEDSLSNSPERWSKAPRFLLVSQATTPEETDLANRIGTARLNSKVCILDRSGEDGWNRWLCHLSAVHKKSPHTGAE